MRNATDLMVQYAHYHRDPRNIASHFVGIPLIVFALGVLLARPLLAQAGALPVTPALLVWAAGAAWYLGRGNPVLALATSAVTGGLFLLAHPLAQGSMAAWLGWGLGSFALGWVIQFVGHWYEGRKPAFVDDLVGLLVGPMFVVGEALFALGWGRPLLAEIERQAGPVARRGLPPHPAG